jgi:glycosyltransferase involved in cell wall biosynthesis
VGGVMETVDEGKTGLLVESGNLEEIIEACNKMLSREELRKEMSVNGPKFIRKRFNVDDMVQKTMHNYCLSS